MSQHEEEDREEWSEVHLLRRILREEEKQTDLLEKIDADLNRVSIVLPGQIKVSSAP